MYSPHSIFRNFYVPKEVDIKDSHFVKRLRKLENHLKENYSVKEERGSWVCTPKKEGKPTLVITPETVLFVMRNLGF